MSRFDHALRYLAALCLGLAVCLTPAIASVSLPHSNIDWSTVGDNVEFHLRFINADAEPTGPVSGTLTPQEFGVFLPGFGSPRPFDIPPLAPDSFFDVFIEIPLAELPQNPPEANTGDGLDVPCPPGDHWDGNIDVLWNGAGEQGEVDYHAGELMVCPGGGASLIHFRTLTCTSPAGMTWSITGLCPDFNAILVEEDMITPAPNPVPPGWTGYISVTAAAGAAVPDTCCFQVTLFCDGVPGVIDLCAITCDCGTAGSNPDLGAVDWETLPGTDIVQFHLRWDNPSLTETTSMISGTMNSQEFGAFMPDFGPIGQFDVPALAPDSFFDIFFEVALADLPPNPITQGEPPPGGPCPTSDHWDGNVDIAWDGSGGPGQVNYHFGDLTVCAGGGASLIHVAELVCPTDMPWTISGLCQDYSAILVDEDQITPAPNPVPPTWSGYIKVTAAAGAAVPDTCCFQVTFLCENVPGVIDLCAITCDCGTAGVGSSLNGLKFGIHSVFPNPTGGSSTVNFALPTAQQAKLEIYDVGGRRVRTLAEGSFEAGVYSVMWDGQDAAGRPAQPGIYFIRLASETQSMSKKLVLRR